MQTTKEEKTERNLRMQSPYRSKMAMREMMKYAYKPRKGLGAKSHGIIEPIEHNGHKQRAGIGYQPTEGKTRTLSSRKKKLRNYISTYTTHLISLLDPLKYIFQKPMPTGKLAKWQILLSEFDIVYITQKAIKGQALAEHLTENPMDEDYEPLVMYFPDEEVLCAREDIIELYPGWRMFFDGAANIKGVGIGAVLTAKSRQHYPASAKTRFPCTNNMAEYKACILGIRMAIDMNIKELMVIGDFNLLFHKVQGEWSTKNVKILPYLHCMKELCKKFTKT
ncbi:uncharacterized protein [Nicotiana tomentosiformis]|uniref:uncharacterized protein n=1 Tax=Nicotiana tomentosiformis TaxID=4098 RepID=UPI00388CC5CC